MLSGQQPPLLPADPSPPFQGIVNLAFDDDVGEPDNEQPDYQSASSFRRSVLLSVDECEELGSEEGGVQTPPHRPGNDPHTPCDVFENDPPQNHPNHVQSDQRSHDNEQQEEKSESVVFLTEIQEPLREEHEPTQTVRGEDGGGGGGGDSSELLPQERPCHLALASHRNPSFSPSDCKRAELHLDLKEPHHTGGSPAPTAQSPTGKVWSSVDPTLPLDTLMLNPSCPSLNSPPRRHISRPSPPATPCKMQTPLAPCLSLLFILKAYPSLL